MKALIAPLTICLSIGWCWVLARLAGSRVLDVPNERSSHSVPKPRVGGLGFIAAFVVGYWMLHAEKPLQLVQPSSGWIFLLLLAAVGFIDDVQGLSIRIRLFTHIAVCVVLTWMCASGTFNLLGAHFDWLTVALLILIGVSLINFFNFMDGIDGLVGGTSIIHLLLAAYLLSDMNFLILAGAVIGFLILNWSPSRVFMGDAGSTFLGGAVFLAVLKSSSLWDVTALLTVTLPLTGDAFATRIWMLTQGQDIFVAHRLHVYQRLVQGGWQHGEVSRWYIGVTIAGAAILIIGRNNWLAPVFAAILSTVFLGVLARYACRTRPTRMVLN